MIYDKIKNCARVQTLIEAVAATMLSFIALISYQHFHYFHHRFVLLQLRQSKNILHNHIFQFEQVHNNAEDMPEVKGKDSDIQ